LCHCLARFVRIFSTPDKVYYSKLRAAFATPGQTAHPAPVGSYSRANDNDLPFVLMMQQQENNQQQQQQQQPQHQHLMEQDHQNDYSKNQLYTGSDIDNETAPDDFILVEVVCGRHKTTNVLVDRVRFIFSRSRFSVKVTRQMISLFLFVRVNNRLCSNRLLSNHL
jgi:hypothetical protein